MFGLPKKPKQVVVTKVTEICDECNGYGGWYSYTEQENIRCPECGGIGKVKKEVHDYKY